MSPVIPWHQRLPEPLSLELDRVAASAHEALVETHAQLADDLVAVLAPRLPFDEAVERYIEIMRLDDDEAEVVGTRALTRLSAREVQEDLRREPHRGWGFDWRYLTPLGTLRFIQRQRKRSAEEQLWLELAAARAEEVLVGEHVKYARLFVELLEEEADPTRAVALYLERLEVPDHRARVVYQRVLAALAEELLPRLAEEAMGAPPPAPPGRERA